MVERSVIDQIKDRNNILEIISEDVELNSRHKGFCPFHEETKPSFSVEPGKQFFRCFGCGVGGDVIRFLQLKQGLSFPEALRTLAERVGITVAELPAELAAEIERQRAKTDMLQEAAEYYHAALTDEIKEYLIKKRGFKEETISEFRLGYAEGGLREHLESKDYPAELCRETGLIREDGQDFFYRVVTIPYCCRGEVKLIRARTHPDQEDKFYFPLKGYGLQLYNEDDLRGADEVIIAEGEFDTLTIKQWGYNVVGVPGAMGFKKEWASKFNHCKLVYIVFDSDKAGIKGAKHIASLIGEKAKIAALPESLDLNDWYCSNKSEEDFQHLLNVSKTRIDIIIDEIEAMPKNRQGEELKQLFPELISLDSVDVAYYRSRICETFKLTKSDFSKALKKAEAEQVEKNNANDCEDARQQKPVELSSVEKDAAAKLLKSEDLLEQFLHDIEQLGCVGEEENKVMVYLTLTSRIQENPISLIVKGESSSGKSFVVNNVAKFFPQEDVLAFTAITAKALYHWKGSLAHKALILQERDGAEDSDYTLRIMLSEKHLVLLTSVKDSETNRYVTEETRVEGPIAYIETTTRTHIHVENETRSFDIFPDESEEQTRRIFATQNQRYLANHSDHRPNLAVWQNAQRLLKPHPVLIPYAEEIEFPKKPIRVRRDRSRFMALIEGNTLLHQYQREKRIIGEIEYLVATIEDYGIAYRLGNKVLSYTVGGLSPRVKELVEVCWRIAEKEAPSSSLETIQAIEFERKDIEREFPCDKTWNRKTIYKYLKAADSEGFIELESQGRGKAIKIRVRKRIDEKSSYLLTPEEIVAKVKANQSELSKPVQSDDGQHSSLSFNELGQVSRVDRPKDKTNFISQ